MDTEIHVEIRPKITPMELAVIQSITEGKSSKEVGQQLGITYKTVEVHRHNAMKRLKCRNMPQLVNMLYHYKILPMMYCKCDGCGKEAPALWSGREWQKPADWLEKVHHRRFEGPDGEPRVIQVCSKECIVVAEERIGLFRLEKALLPPK